MTKPVTRQRKCSHVEFQASEGFQISEVSREAQVMYEKKMNRMLAVLDEAIRKTRISLSLPILVRNDGELLRQFLSPEAVDTVLTGCNQYILDKSKGVNQRPSSTMRNYRTDGSIDKCPEPLDRWQQALGDLYKISSSGLKCRHDPNMARALYVIQQNPGLMDAIDQHFSLLVHPSSNVLLDNLSRLRSCVAERLKVGPVEAIQREKDLRLHWAGGNEFPSRLADLLSELDDQRQQLGGMVAGKAREIARLRAAITHTRRQCQDDVRLMVNASERQMLFDSRTSEHRSNILNADLKAEKERLANMLAEHLKEEKELRTKKHKMETLLVTWMQKFDTEIGDKQAEFDQLTEEYETEQAEMADLQTQLADIEEEFLKLLEEKERYEQEEEDELVYQLRSLWAARVIQRYWREYRIRKAMKKGKGKGKGKKGKGKWKKK